MIRPWTRSTPPSGLKRWIETTNHKDIGAMYLVFGLIMLAIGGLLALGIRAELFRPGLQFMQPELFNQFVTLHGLVMVFGFAMPVATGLANYMLPLILGAPDMALPRLNNWGFWILPPAAVLWFCRSCWGCSISDQEPSTPGGPCTRRCRSKAVGAWTSPSSRCTCSVYRPSWARSTSL